MSIIAQASAERRWVEDPDLLPYIDALEKLDLLDEDGEPLESEWHVLQIFLLIETIRYYLRERDDYYAGGNMLVYYSLDQAREVAEEVLLGKEPKKAFRGPDFLYVSGVSPLPARRSWVVWREGGHYPDLIIELASRKTAKTDRVKKDIYEKIFRTREYFICDPRKYKLTGWRLEKGQYAEIPTDENGRFECQVLGLRLGMWKGIYQNLPETWLRFFDAKGKMLPTGAEAGEQQAEAERKRANAEQERADAERQRAETERQRAEAAEAELAKLRSQVGNRKNIRKGKS